MLHLSSVCTIILQACQCRVNGIWHCQWLQQWPHKLLIILWFKSQAFVWCIQVCCPWSHIYLYDSSQQTSKLLRELNCICWANGLLDLVYDFVKSALQCHGLLTFPIPQMWFVQAMPAISQDQHREVYMIEEAIDETFTKYIGNDNSHPLLQWDPELEEIGEFLAFAQHVQYEKSGQMAFVADFQGEHVT